MPSPSHCRMQTFLWESVAGVSACYGRPSGQGSELWTMADFSRRVSLDELRSRGLMKGLRPEALEQISRWPSAHARGGEACTQLIAYTHGST